jgi:glycosyltransferase involved in cell wall biosynthesis
MIKAFRDIGHEVEMSALVGPEEGSRAKIRGGVWRGMTRWAPNWLYELMGLIYNIFGYWRLCQVIQRKGIDLLYERYALNTFCGIWASRRFKIPLILEVNAPLYLEQSELGRLTFRRLARFSERWICSHSTWTIVVSKVMKDLLAQQGVAQEKMVVMPNGVDPRIFHPHVCGREVRQRYSLEANLVIGFVGWFRAWHGLEMLLEIMYEAALGDKGVRLLLIGDGPAYPDIYEYAKTHYLQSSIIFPGPVGRQEVPAYIAAIDIAVLPSATAYACPMKIIEYMAMGKCIVAPDQPNIREILEDRVTGFLFQAGDKESLQSTLLELLGNPAKREVVGREAHTRLHGRKFLWNANAQKTVALILGHEPQAHLNTR